MSEALTRIERPRSIHEVVQDAIRTYIVTEGLEPGDSMLSEGELARRFGVSRNSVREAVRSLESVGVLESRHGSGLFVSEFSWEPVLDSLAYELIRDVSSLSELLEIRRVLETGMVDRAVELLTAEQLAELESLLARMAARAAQGQAFPDEDREFHRVLFKELENTTFLKLLDIFWLAFRRVSKRTDLLDVAPIATVAAHGEILDALRSRDVGRTRRALEDHYRAVDARLRRELGPVSPQVTEHRKEDPR